MHFICETSAWDDQQSLSGGFVLWILEPHLPCGIGFMRIVQEIKFIAIYAWSNVLNLVFLPYFLYSKTLTSNPSLFVVAAESRLGGESLGNRCIVTWSYDC